MMNLPVEEAWCIIFSSYLQKRGQNKRRPSFRKLLKTSNVKIDNKTKNKQFKQTNVVKKQRKENRKLRQAISDVSTKIPQPLERYHKNPGELLKTDLLSNSLIIYIYIFYGVDMCFSNFWTLVIMTASYMDEETRLKRPFGFLVIWLGV